MWSLNSSLKLPVNMQSNKTPTCNSAIAELFQKYKLMNALWHKKIFGGPRNNLERSAKYHKRLGGA